MTPLDDIPGIVERARSAQEKWANEPLAKRIHAIAQLRTRILGRAEEIGKLVSEEVGKPEVEAILAEVVPSGDVVTYWTELVGFELEPTEVRIDPISYPKKRGWVHREARGVVALITPWNFPVALPLRTLVPALLAGNAVVLKPSEVTPKSGELLVKLFEGLVPEGLLGIVTGAGDAGAKLVESNVDLVVFTGSTKTGKAIAHACAERLIPCTLELGGKDAAIVLEDADLDRAANGIVWGALNNAGQNCASVERVYAVKAIADKLSEKIVAATKALRAGQDYGKLATPAQLAIVEAHVGAAKAAGHEVLLGDKAGEPMVFKMNAGETPLMEDETFGPVIPIAEVADVEEAITRANASRYGLTASVWTSNIDAAEKIAKRLRAGVVTINNHAFTGALPSAPWGGVGSSGWGVTGSPLALDHLTRPRFVLVDRNAAVRETWWFPYSPVLRVLALANAAVRGGAAGLGAKVAALVTMVGAFMKRQKELSS